MKKLLLVAASTFSLAVPSGASAATYIKNVIIMVADGAGYNMLQSSRLFGGPLAVDAPSFLRTSVSTYPLRSGSTPIPGPAGLAQDPNTIYNSARNWDTTPVAGTTGGYPRGFAGYEWNRATAPDSANTIAALMTGEKTYNNAVNVDGNGAPLLTLAELAASRGRSAGVVSTVQFSDATPAAGGGAHNVSRGNRQEIANEMFSAGVLDVIAGAGNPDYDNNGAVRAAPNYSWISPALWQDLKNGTNVSGSNAQNWTLAQNRAEIEALAAGSSAAAPEKLAMITRAFDGAQQYRDGLIASTDDPFATPLLDTTPTFSDLTIAALKTLNKDSDGLYLLSEAGTVDRAMHANNLGRAIEGYLEFDQGVRDVIDYINSAESLASFEDTLLLVTADHDHLLFGPDAATDPFQAVQPDGPDAGLLPEHRWFSGSHSNQLVPLFAMGQGANDVIALADQLDFYQDAQGRSFGYGNYTDQAELGRFLLDRAAAVPEPATWAMLIAGFGFVGAAARRRRSHRVFA